jgi:lipopolysaccharide transport system permease protein
MVATGTTVLFYLTPIVYPLAKLPARLRAWLTFNPLVGVTQAVQSFFVPIAVDLRALAVSLVSAVLVLALGVALFSRRAAAVRDLV